MKPEVKKLIIFSHIFSFLVTNGNAKRNPKPGLENISSKCDLVTPENFSYDNAKLLKSTNKRFSLKCKKGFEPILSDNTRFELPVVQFVCRPDSDDSSLASWKLADSNSNSERYFIGCQSVSCPIPTFKLTPRNFPNIEYLEKSADNSRQIFTLNFQPKIFNRLFSENKYNPDNGWTFVFQLQEESYITFDTMFLYPLNSENLSYNRRINPRTFTEDHSQFNHTDENAVDSFKTLATQFSVTSGSYNKDIRRESMMAEGINASGYFSFSNMFKLMFSFKSDYQDLPEQLNFANVYFYNNVYVNTACLSDDITKTMLKSDGKKEDKEADLTDAGYQLITYNFATQTEGDIELRENLSYNPELCDGFAAMYNTDSDTGLLRGTFNFTDEFLADSDKNNHAFAPTSVDQLSNNFQNFLSGQVSQIQSDDNQCLSVSSENAIPFGYSDVDSGQNMTAMGFEMIWTSCYNQTEINADDPDDDVLRQSFIYDSVSNILVNQYNYKCLSPLPISNIFHPNLDPCDSWSNFPGMGSYLFLVDCDSHKDSQKFGYDFEFDALVSGCQHRLPIGKMNQSNRAVLSRDRFTFDGNSQIVVEFGE